MQTISLPMEDARRVQVLSEVQLCHLRLGLGMDLTSKQHPMLTRGTSPDLTSTTQVISHHASQVVPNARLQVPASLGTV